MRDSGVHVRSTGVMRASRLTQRGINAANEPWSSPADQRHADNHLAA